MLVAAFGACSGGEGSEGTQTGEVELLVAPVEVVAALRAESTEALFRVMGIDVAGSAAGVVDRRQETDEAIERFSLVLDRSRSRGGVAYGDALSSLRDVARLRGEVDAHPGPATPEVVNEIADGYSAMAEDLLDAHGQVVLAVDDADLRRGGRLLQTGLRQSQLLERFLAFAVGRTTYGGPLDAVEVSELAALHAGLEQGRADVVELAAGSDYESIADSLDADVQAAGYIDALAEMIETGQYRVTVIAEIAGWIEPWFRLVDRIVDDLLATRAQRS